MALEFLFTPSRHKALARLIRVLCVVLVLAEDESSVATVLSVRDPHIVGGKQVDVREAQPKGTAVPRVAPPLYPDPRSVLSISLL